jgi:hypothetical protein
MNLTIDAATAARTEAIFASDLATGTCPTRREADAAIRSAIDAGSGVPGCLAEVAMEYGNCPETAVPRMCWARELVLRLYTNARNDARTDAPSGGAR